MLQRLAVQITFLFFLRSLRTWLRSLPYYHLQSCLFTTDLNPTSPPPSSFFSFLCLSTLFLLHPCYLSLALLPYALLLLPPTCPVFLTTFYLLLPLAFSTPSRLSSSSPSRYQYYFSAYLPILLPPRLRTPHSLVAA